MRINWKINGTLEVFKLSLQRVSTLKDANDSFTIIKLRYLSFFMLHCLLMDIFSKRLWFSFPKPNNAWWEYEWREWRGNVVEKEKSYEWFILDLLKLNQKSIIYYFFFVPLFPDSRQKKVLKASSPFWIFIEPFSHGIWASAEGFQLLLIDFSLSSYCII